MRPDVPAPSPTPVLVHRLAPLLLSMLASLLVVSKVREAIDVGPGWDTYAFLANAADFAGKAIGYTEPHRPPMISLITSIWFRVAPLSEAAIQWVDGAITVSGVLAVFLLLRRRVGTTLALGGAFAFLGITPLWEYLGVGYTDTAAIAICAWTLLALIAATERHPGFYLLAGPLFTAAVMMRYTALLFAFPLLVWALLRWRPFPQARFIAGGALLALAAYLPFGVHYAGRFGDALFPFLFAFSLSETVTVPGGEDGASAQASYYLSNLPHLLGPPGIAWVGILLMLVAAYGLYALAAGHLAVRRPSPSRALLVVLAIAVAAVAQMELGLVARQFTIAIAVWIVWRSLAGDDDGATHGSPASPVSALDAAMLTWFLVYLDFHGHQTIQVPRYFITMAPGLLYFTTLGWRAISTRLRAVLAMARFTHRLAPSPDHALAAVVALSLAVAPFVQTLQHPREPDLYVAAARDSAAWLSAVDSSADRKVIYSDLWPLTAWYLSTGARPMPFFEDIEAFAHELDKADADYFFTLRGRRFDRFEEVHVSGPVTVLARTEADPVYRPRVAYLGKSWDNYVEQLTGFTFYLNSTAGRYGFEGSAFLDAYDYSSLEKFDAVGVAGFRWHDRASGEAALREYVTAGGSVVIDASQNLGGLAHSVTDTIMLETMIRRAQLPAEASITLSPEFSEQHPELGTIRTSPWIDESGGAWTGAYYEARPGTPRLETLASVDGRPLIQLQHLGEGRIYWIAFNLPWHAFMNENEDEARLVRAVFEEAISATQLSRGQVGGQGPE